MKYNLKRIIPPEGEDMPILALYPITKSGYSGDWAVGSTDTVSSNVYVLAVDISKHISKVYRYVVYGADQEIKIELLANFFIKGVPTYFFKPLETVLSFATDGTTFLSHGLSSSTNLFRSYLSILNPFLRHGKIPLKLEYNSIELFNKINSTIGFPCYISGLGMWTSAGQLGMYGLW